MKTSLLTSIYHKNTEEELNRCFNSIINQKSQPDEIILIVDGPVKLVIRESIIRWSSLLPIKFFWLPNNMGLAYALNYGLLKCKYDWIFRIDIDDVCANNRFILQIDKIISNPEIDILGGDILNFEVYPNFKNGRKVPYNEKKIFRYIIFRNPVNHSTVFFNKIKILEIGGYPNARLGQDYLLWIHAINSGLKISNLNEVLVYMQVDKNCYQRRGLKNFKYDSYPYKLMFRLGLTNIIELILGLIFRLIYCTYASFKSLIRI
jgi:glycosyltransferase involved in cell wall biosynthesis